MARSMGVSRSGFYAWQAREPSARDIVGRELAELIRQIHATSRESYGAPRLHAELADSGVHVGRKRVERLMKAASLTGVSRRRNTQRKTTQNPWMENTRRGSGRTADQESI